MSSLNFAITRPTKWPSREVLWRLWTSTNRLDVELARCSFNDVLDGMIAEMARLEDLILKEKPIGCVDDLVTMSFAFRASLVRF